MNDAVYLALYAMAAAVDEWLKRGGHLRDSQGRMITHFDEWLQAVERGERAVDNGQQS